MTQLTPQYNYARLVPPEANVTFRKFNVFDTYRNVFNAMKEGKSTDYELANLSDRLRMGGGLLIAALATAGAAGWLLGIGEFLGFASWFAAMGLTPKIVNTAVKLKTGINLDQDYINSNGERVALFKDPQYMPLYLIPDEEIQQIADRLKIPEGPNRREKTEKKMKQVATQARTWWMLVAGPATPVISGLVCDTLVNPLASLSNTVQTWWQKQGLINPDITSKIHEKTTRYVDLMVGDTSNSRLTHWWKGLSTKLVSKLDLPNLLGNKKISTLSDEYIMKTLYHELGSKQKIKSYHIGNALKHLTAYEKRLSDMEKEMTRIFEAPHIKTKIGSKKYAYLTDKIEAKIQSAKSTVSRLVKLFEDIHLTGIKSSELKFKMEQATLSRIQVLDRTHGHSALSLIDDPKIYKKVTNHITSGQYKAASELLGSSPKNVILTGLKQLMPRQRWQRRILKWWGGGLLVATALFTLFALGKSKQKNRGELA